MKKVKIMLVSLSVLAIVGGALAFKATKVTGLLKCGTSTNSCPVPGFDPFTPGTFTYCTDAVTGNTTVCDYLEVVKE